MKNKYAYEHIYFETFKLLSGIDKRFLNILQIIGGL